MPTPLDARLEALLADPAHRDELSYIEKAQVLQARHEEGWNSQKIEERYGIKRAMDWQLRDLLNLSPEDLDKVHKGLISFKQARILRTNRPGIQAGSNGNDNDTQGGSTGSNPKERLKSGSTPGSTGIQAGSNGKSNSNAVPVGSLITALKDDILNRHLWRLGRVGGVLKDWVDKIWEGRGQGSAGGKGGSFFEPLNRRERLLIRLVIIGFAVSLVFRVVGYPLRWAANRALSGLTHISSPLSPVGGLHIQSIAVPTPEITQAVLAPGHKFELHWTTPHHSAPPPPTIPVGNHTVVPPTPQGGRSPDYTYRVYVDYFDNPGRPDFEPVMSNAVKTPGAIVNVDKARAPSSGKVTLAVMAINSAGMESELSNPVEVDLSVSNTVNSVAPLGNIITPHPPSGSPLSHNGERVMLKTVSIQNNLLPLGEGQRMRVPDTTGPPPIAQGLKAWVLNSGTAKGTRPLARVQWESLGQGWRYNLYYSADADLSNPLKENSAPFDYAAVDWSPDVKGKQYWVAVTAVNSKGEESYHSVPVQVVFQKPSVSILQTLKNTISGARDAEGTASSAKNLITNPR